MKTVLITTAVAAAALFAQPAAASEELAKAKCGKCHEMEKKKKGPPYKETAAKYKGKADAEATLLKAIMDPKGDHPEMENVTAEDARTVLKWVLSR